MGVSGRGICGQLNVFVSVGMCELCACGWMGERVGVSDDDGGGWAGG